MSENDARYNLSRDPHRSVRGHARPGRHHRARHPLEQLLSARTFPIDAEIPMDPGRGWLLILRASTSGLIPPPGFGKM